MNLWATKCAVLTVLWCLFYWSVTRNDPFLDPFTDHPHRHRHRNPNPNPNPTGSPPLEVDDCIEQSHLNKEFNELPQVVLSHPSNEY